MVRNRQIGQAKPLGEIRGVSAFRSTIRHMARTPDGAMVRTLSVTTRMTPVDVATLDSQRRLRGGMDRGAYIRWLIKQDGRRIARERGTGNDKND